MHINTNTFPKLLCLLVVFMLFSCKNNDRKAEPEVATSDFEKCKYGKPVAIFSDTVPSVKKHTFEEITGGAMEKVLFDNGVGLELKQTGCNKATQTFTFYLFGDFTQRKDYVWLEATEGLFKYMGGLSPSLQPLLQWANALDKIKKTMKLRQPATIENNFQITIDRISAKEATTLIVTLTEV